MVYHAIIVCFEALWSHCFGSDSFGQRVRCSNCWYSLLMNPDTKLTIEQLKYICSRHNIPYHSHERVTVGFSHEVHRLNDDLIIKLFNTKDLRRFQTERALLASEQPIRKPKLIASAEPDVIVDRGYVIMPYIPGLSLGSYWHRASDEQREKLIEEISQSLKIINKIKPSDIALEPGGSWRDLVVKRGEDLVAKLQATHTLDRDTAETTLRVLRGKSQILDGTGVLPVYWDIHFDNFIVSERFELQALIDLENVELASLDYPLFVVQKQMDEPEKYLREEDEKYADKEDYAKLKDWYRKYCPEMFAFDDLEVRVRLYQLLDTLHLLVDWSHVKSLYTKLDELLVG